MRPYASAQAQDDEQPAARITRVWFQHEVHNWNMRYLDVGTAKKISKIGLGTWQFGAEEWGYGKLGVTLFDTAEIYGSGRSKRILGQALGETESRPSSRRKCFRSFPSAQVVRQRAVASAKRLGVPHLDLYQAHWPNPLVRDSTLMRSMRSLACS